MLTVATLNFSRQFFSSDATCHFFRYNSLMKRSGVADLPLHGGRVPPWLAERMTRLGTAITETIIHDYGTSAFLSRLSDPFWFQSLGAVMGMDWHSSGITTSVMGALKRGLASRADELGLYICGGRGRHSRKTPTRIARRSLIVADLMAKPCSHQPADGAGRQQCDRGWLSDLSAQFRGDFERRMGRRAAGFERSQRHGSPLSLAFSFSPRLRCRTAYRNSWREPGHDHEPGRCSG